MAKDLAHEGPDRAGARSATEYEPPALVVLGTVADLTRGVGGTNIDGSFGSGFSPP